MIDDPGSTFWFADWDCPSCGGQVITDGTDFSCNKCDWKDITSKNE